MRIKKKTIFTGVRSCC